MRFLILTGLMALTLAACSGNDTATTDDVKAGKGKSEKGSLTEGANVIRISVPSIQCESCAKTIRTALKDVKGTEEVDVKVEDKAVFVRVANNTPDMKSQIEHAISDAGYRTETRDRNAAAYEALPDCCKEGGMH